jgi:copper(I)-binding protein
MTRAAVAGVVVALLGVAGLVRAQVSPAGGGQPAAAIRVVDAWVRQPVPPSTTAAAYFTVHNTGATADLLQSVVSPIGATTVLHAVVNGRMTADPAGVAIPAHGTFRLSVGSGHAMIEGLRAPLTSGERVPLVLTFQRFGTVTVSARVVGYLDPVPTG